MNPFFPDTDTATAATLQRLADLIESEGLSLAVETADGRTLRGRLRGVADLRRLLDEPGRPLCGACVADRVVGKGAAALMAAGGVRALRAGVLSRAAAALLAREGLPFACDTPADHIVRRDGRGICPVEAACADTDSVEGCLQRIDAFLRTAARPDNPQETSSEP